MFMYVMKRYRIIIIYVYVIDYYGILKANEDYSESAEVDRLQKLPQSNLQTD